METSTDFFLAGAKGGEVDLFSLFFLAGASGGEVDLFSLLCLAGARGGESDLFSLSSALSIFPGINLNLAPFSFGFSSSLGDSGFESFLVSGTFSDEIVESSGCLCVTGVDITGVDISGADAR